MRASPFFFTWTSQSQARPFELTGGQGAWFETGPGERWLDFGSLSFQANLGHGHPRMVEAICAQAKQLCLSAPSAVYPAKTRLAEQLLELLPKGFSKVFFTLGGADAIENALKFARMVTGRHKLVSRYQSYHGASMGAVSLSGDWRRPPVEPGLPGVVHVLDWMCNRCPDGRRDEHCNHRPLSNIPAVMELEGPNSVAAVFVEPVVGANGVLIPPPGYFAELREACDAHGSLLVVDEVLTGFGRTGTWFGFEHFDDVLPDMITMGKALTGGYGTLGAVAVNERVAQHFDDRVLYAGLTHYGHPLGVAAASEAIRIYEEEQLIDQAPARGEQLRGELQQLHQDFPEAFGPSRSKGLLSATPVRATQAQWERFAEALREQHLHAHLKPGLGLLVLAPPLCLSRSELQEGFAKVRAAVSQTWS